MAIMAKQVRVPEELQLIVHRNDQVGLFCPLKADFLASSSREMAGGMISQLDTLFHGRQAHPLVLQYRIVPGEEE